MFRNRKALNNVAFLNLPAPRSGRTVSLITTR
jgi:hypothetical protein